jgi:hypothetical protein
MAATLDNALTRFIEKCVFVTAVHDLMTKWRIDLKGGYFLDIYFNRTTGKYSYTLSQGEQRILGWDNAPHHPSQPNFPHHFHKEDGLIVSSDLNGDPDHDLDIVRVEIEKLLK